MENGTQTLQEGVDLTKKRLKADLQLLENILKEEISSVKDGLNESKEKIQNALHRMSVGHQVNERPLTCFAISLGLGLLGGLVVAGRAGVALSSGTAVKALRGAAPSAFALDGIRHFVVRSGVGSFAAKLLIEKGREILLQKFPQQQETIEKFCAQMMQKYHPQVV